MKGMTGEIIIHVLPDFLLKLLAAAKIRLLETFLVLRTGVFSGLDSAAVLDCIKQQMLQSEGIIHWFGLVQIWSLMFGFVLDTIITSHRTHTPSSKPLFSFDVTCSCWHTSLKWMVWANSHSNRECPSIKKTQPRLRLTAMIDWDCVTSV